MFVLHSQEQADKTRERIRDIKGKIRQLQRLRGPGGENFIISLERHVIDLKEQVRVYESKRVK